jgi:glycosyltransferase involved in cell wall biosynthesis
VTVKVALDMTFADRNAGGTGTYARSLLAALQARDDVITHRVGIPPGASTAGTLRWLGGGARRALKESPVADLLHCPAFVVPWRSPVPYVVTIHDAAARHEPRDHPLEWRLYDRWFLPERAWRAQAVITGTHHAAADLTRHYGIRSERIRVTPYGIDEGFLGQPADRPPAPAGSPPRLLFPGAPIPRKNLDIVLRALAAAPPGSKLAEATLAITGASGSDFPELVRQIRGLGLDERVTWLGVIEFTRLPAVLRAADLVVYPSRHEGFGFPPLEAMAVGTPVVASTASCLPEVLGNAALLVSPDDLGGLIEAVESVLTRPALGAHLAEAGRRHAAGFTWARCAEQTVTVYREATGG